MFAISFDMTISALLYKAINDLCKFEWFKKSVRDIRAYKVEDWSDFTQIVRES